MNTEIINILRSQNAAGECVHEILIAYLSYFKELKSEVKDLKQRVKDLERPIMRYGSRNKN